MFAATFALNCSMNNSVAFKYIVCGPGSGRDFAKRQPYTSTKTSASSFNGGFVVVHVNLLVHIPLKAAVTVDLSYDNCGVEASQKRPSAPSASLFRSSALLKPC